MTAALAAALLLVPCASTAAQSRIEAGALGGLSLASVTESGNENLGIPGVSAESRRRTGFQLGAYLRLPVGGIFSLEPELHYIRKGVNFDAVVPIGLGTGGDSSPLASGDISLDLAYVEMPVLLRADFGQSGRVRPFVVAGAAVAYRVACTVSVRTAQGSFGTDCDVPSDEGDGPLRTWDAGGIVGAGLAGDIGQRRVSVQARYSRGFTTLARQTVDGYAPRNSVISILLGVGFQPGSTRSRQGAFQRAFRRSS